jgi:hypothetical protein
MHKSPRVLWLPGTKFTRPLSSAIGGPKLRALVACLLGAPPFRAPGGPLGCRLDQGSPRIAGRSRGRVPGRGPEARGPRGPVPHQQPPRRNGPAGPRARGGGHDGYTNTSPSFAPASHNGRSGGRRLGGYDHSSGRRTFFRPGVEGTSPCQATSALPARHRLHLRRVVAVQRIRLLRLHALDIPQPRRLAPSLVDGPVPSRRRERERPDTQPQTSQGRRPRLPQDNECPRRSRGHIRRTREVHLVNILGGSSPAVDLGSVLLGPSLGGSDQAARNALGQIPFATSRNSCDLARPVAAHLEERQVPLDLVGRDVRLVLVPLVSLVAEQIFEDGLSQRLGDQIG